MISTDDVDALRERVVRRIDGLAELANTTPHEDIQAAAYALLLNVAFPAGRRDDNTQPERSP